MNLINEISRIIVWLDHANEVWKPVAVERLLELEELLPSGSGIDSGCKVSVEESSRNKIVIEAPYHVMNDVGYYVGWVEYTVTVTPDLMTWFEMEIESEEVEDEELREAAWGIDDYLEQLFDGVLKEEYQHG